MFLSSPDVPVRLRQAFQECLIHLFDCDDMHNLLLKGDGARAQLLEICEEYFKQVGQAQATLTRMENMPALELVRTAVQRVKLFCRCLVHLLGGAMAGTTTSSADVTYFYQFKGQSAWEKRVRAVLMKPGTFWNEACEEVIRVGAQSALLAPELASFREQLCHLPADGLPAAESLQAVCDLYSRLSSQLRKIELAGDKDTLSSSLQRFAKRVVDSDPASVEAGVVDAILAGLQIFKEIPGSTSSMEDVRSWLSTHRAAVAGQDLLATLGQASDQNFDHERVLELLNKMDPLRNHAPEEAIRFDKPVYQYLRMLALGLCEKASQRGGKLVTLTALSWWSLV